MAICGRGKQRHTGDGGRDSDFGGKTTTVRSTNTIAT